MLICLTASSTFPVLFIGILRVGVFKHTGNTRSAFHSINIPFSHGHLRSHPRLSTNGIICIFIKLVSVIGVELTNLAIILDCSLLKVFTVTFIHVRIPVIIFIGFIHECRSSSVCASTLRGLLTPLQQPCRGCSRIKLIPCPPLPVPDVRIRLGRRRRIITSAPSSLQPSLPLPWWCLPNSISISISRIYNASSYPHRVPR
mmetsp:Transcript_24486/g.39790  ORF Transcript_24486/g.39790 Transcript_24486/m.39790 type:complete len:201 (-) Transcript_24486:222-824(-)